MRFRIWALVALVGLGLAVDLARAPDRQVGARVVVAGIHVYQATLARLFAVGGVACRFDPTCSHYGEAVIRRFGLARGGWMATKRVLRCGPWTPMGTADPPPVAG
jgi:putative membrane protein insertion efficiency factor